MDAEFLSQHAGVVAAVIGSVGGVFGGLLGTYVSIRATNGPRERAFVVRCSVAMWAGITLFVGLMLWMTSPAKFLLFVPYSFGFPIAMRRLSGAQSKIREDEARERAESSGPAV
jgi:hypothetical protein